MTNMLARLTWRPRLTKTKLLLMPAITAVVISATFLHADSGASQSEQNGLAGTWTSLEFGGVNILSFMSDGRMTYTAPINIATGNGPGGLDELATPASGEWIRTSNGEFTSTTYSILSSPPVGSAHLVKLIGNYTLNKTSDELTLTGGSITVYLPDGTPQFPAFPSGIEHFKRVIAGQ